MKLDPNSKHELTVELSQKFENASYTFLNSAKERLEENSALKQELQQDLRAVERNGLSGTFYSLMQVGGQIMGLEAPVKAPRGTQVDEALKTSFLQALEAVVEAFPASEDKLSAAKKLTQANAFVSNLMIRSEDHLSSESRALAGAILVRIDPQQFNKALSNMHVRRLDVQATLKAAAATGKLDTFNLGCNAQSFTYVARGGCHTNQPGSVPSHAEKAATRRDEVREILATLPEASENPALLADYDRGVAVAKQACRPQRRPGLTARM